MSSARFWSLWSNLHVVDNTSAPASGSGGVSCKIKPVLDVLGRTFLDTYDPRQELSVDEGMVKYKGQARGKVVMPNKPIKKGFKIWCCSCSCCGYLCTFQVYHGSHVDAFSGKKVPEKGLAKQVVLDLTASFVGVNHVVYCDNFYSSGPLADGIGSMQSYALVKDKIFITGTIKMNASGFQDSLKSHKPPQSGYVSK